MRRFVFAAIIATLLPLQALAHAQLRASEPAEGAVVDSAPAEIILTFNEPVSPLVLRLIGPDGAAVDLDGAAENADLSVRLPETVGDGTHLLSWRIVSADGHPVGGTLTFHVGAASAVPPTTAEPVGSMAWLVAALRFVLTTALVLSVGAAVFAALVLRGPPSDAVRRFGQIAGLLSLPSGVALLAAQGLDLLALPPRALLTAPPWQAVLAAPIAFTVTLSVTAAALSFMALGNGADRMTRPVAVAAWALAGVSFAVSGHAAAASPRWLTAPAIAVHAVALIFWLGAFIPLLSALRAPDAASVMRRFSDLAIPLVALLITTGVALTWAQTDGDLAGLASSSYGLLLGAKLVLVLGLLALAARNRLTLTPALAEGQAGVGPRLARAIRLEIVIGLVILALASGFRLTPPPRALAVSAEPIYAHIHTGRAMVDMTLSPGRVGPLEIELAFQTGDFAELVPQEVEVGFAMPDAGIEPIRTDAQPGEDGLWRAGPVTLPTPGEWEVSLRILVTDFESVTLRETITLPR
ncbi:MAG: copper resistance protein CopC [Pseudomonadota bacterium]